MIQSVQRATRLLSILADNYTQPVTLATLAEQAGIHKSTCAHLISTLEEEGFAVRISHSRGYVLGPAAYCLSRFGGYKSELVDVCRPVMKYLHQHTGYTVVLAIVEGGTKYIIHFIDSNEIFDKETRIHADDIYRTATGRAILVNLSQADVIDIFKKYGNPTKKDWPEVSNLEEYKKYAAQVKKNGVFKSQGCFSADNVLNIGYGAALFSSTRCVGALGIALKMTEEEEKVFVQEEEQKLYSLLRHAVAEINRRLLK